MLKRTAPLLALLLLLGPSAKAVTVAVESTSSTPGDTPYICINLPDNDGQVSGVQMDLGWDATCLSMATQSANEGACNVNSATNRNTFRTRLFAGSAMKVIMLNISDTAPIPASEQQLFCCQFQVSPSAGGRTCAISLNNVIASDPNGKRLQVSTRPGAITVAAGAANGGMAAPRGGALGGGAGVPALIGGAPEGSGGGGGGTSTSGGSVTGAAPAPKAVLPSGQPGAAPGAVPGLPAAPPAPEAQGAPDGSVDRTPVAVTPEAGGTPARTPAKGTPTAKGTAKETPKPVGTPTAKASAQPGTATPGK